MSRECQHPYRVETHCVIYCDSCGKDLYYLEIDEYADHWEPA